VRRPRQAVVRPVNAASSGARPSQGDPTFELMAAEKRWEDSVRHSPLFNTSTTQVLHSPGLIECQVLQITGASRNSALQIREGRVKSISAKAAGELKQDGWVFLDVRPPPEIEKVHCSLMLQDDPVFPFVTHMHDHETSLPCL
jgi:hypothetical protein